jgi:hypothetical protein
MVLRRLALAAVTCVALASCSSVQTVRVQPDNLYVGPGMKPIAIVHAQVTSFYFMFAAIPGGVDLDRVVNRMLLATAKAMGADKVVNIRVDITPSSGIWVVRRILGWRSAEASGVAVVMDPAQASPSAPAPATQPTTP